MKKTNKMYGKERKGGGVNNAFLGAYFINFNT
jgi:hypothetical protein